ncbi:aspartyl protease family protein [Cellulophaga lytica]|uniref:PDZ/DHR/GLGF domain protein n=1 Tax=Cellulophaga lytica (strain ATCC 23178 / DSM 7489 / JCM 8516 / NBRC 14961 / NCIMB 1423 / VKM B-1433 / Cy l20) TaxID=867900 RepID=F0RAM3_CELLC|nr:aspartyl protease family protein [Cellulophaga lytica]ADY28416.1 PDZ/DHR/GLGF domain protein [Cellulophaga lytica DSM 7489]WQG77407.1 aspartyl protease family protein [Cellulophaga lytica]
MKLKALIFCMLFSIVSGAQTFELPEGKKYEKIKFKLVNNLIVLPAKINGAQFTFILDTGVSKPILFNFADQDSVDIKNVSEITIRGLGGGEPIKALKSTGNLLELNSFKNANQLVYIVLDKDLNFSPKLGMPVHGILGYDFFKNHIVEINYTNTFIKVHNPKNYKQSKNKKIEYLPLSLERKKAYIEAKALVKKNTVPVKLLIDTGSSDAVWLFENKIKGISIQHKYFEDFLGKGLSGDIYGKRTKIDQFKLGSYVIKDTKTAFPDSISVKYLTKKGERNGSVGGEVLKRFNWVFDYPNKQVSFKKNSNYKKPFWFRTSGMALQHGGLRYIKQSRLNAKKGLGNVSNNSFTSNVTVSYDNEVVISLVPQIVVSNLREGSPAKDAGLKIGDVILEVNKKEAHKYKLQELTHMVDDLPGKKVVVLVERRGERLLFNLRIKNLFK